MPLPHFTQLLMTGSPGTPGTDPGPEEAVYLNLFEITFILPTILQESTPPRDPVMMLQQAKKINIDLTKDIGVSQQRFKYSTRAFMNTPEQTHVEFGIDFNVNVNKNNEMTVWNTLKAWYDLVWNSQNGAAFYKSDLIGTIIVNQHDKKGVVLRRITFWSVQMKGIGSYDLDWGSSGIQETVSAQFVSDYWTDQYFDSNASQGIDTPTVYT
jgi:hypothetical protein